MKISLVSHARSMRRCSTVKSLAVLFALTFLTVNLSKAEDPKTADLSGTWILKFNSPNGDKTRLPLKLKQEGETVTGKLKRGDGMENEIQEGLFKDGQLTFSVQSQRNQRTITSKYSSKLTGDQLKGTFESNFGGNTRTIPWEASRKRNDATGLWKWTFMRDDGQPMEFALKLKEENGQLSGVSVSPSGTETPIANAQTKDNEISFKVIRERDDKKFTTAFHGKRIEDAIAGKLEADWTGEMKSYDWTAKRVSDDW
jgi:hypothetical protein